MGYSISLIKCSKLNSEALDQNTAYKSIKSYPFKEWARIEVTNFITAYGGEFGKELKLTKTLLDKILDDERIARKENRFNTHKSYLLKLKHEYNWLNRLFFDYYIIVC